MGYTSTVWVYFYGTYIYGIYIYGIYIYGIFFYGIYFYGTYFYESKKSKIIEYTNLCTKRVLQEKLAQSTM
jgi:hypothetical protein